ncbi:hypothetical protein C8B47_15330, partial [filamentous cyanobacterium CCP4]
MAPCDRTILVVDDGTSGSADLYQHLLESDSALSYRVIAEPYDGPIVELCRTCAVDGILLESHSPDLRSFEALTRLRDQLGEHCPSVIVIDVNDANLARKAFQAGAADYLIREQVSADTLHQALNAAMPVTDKASVATALLPPDDRYRDLVESLDEGFCLCQMLLNQEGAPVDYRFLEVNAVFESLTGLQQPVGKTARELVPDLEESWFETYGRVAIDRQPIRFEQQSVPMHRWFDLYAFPMGKPEHHLFGILFRNITIRKIVEQEREKFFTVGSDLQAISDRDGYFRWVSPSFERVLGWTTAEITARPWTEFIHPNDINRSVLEEESLFSGQETLAFENRYRHKDGSYRWLLWRVQPDSAQQLLYGAAVDITESKRRAANTAFLAEIATEFSRLSTADEIMQTVGAKIGAYLNLFACAFVEIDHAEVDAVINYAWHAKGTPDPVGTYHIADFLTDDFREAARNQETVVVRDVKADSRIHSEPYAAVEVNSLVSVPFHQEGRWRFMLNVYDSVPHDWRDDEVDLIRELAHQIFPRLERARAEAALRESEARFKGFAENSNDVIWITDAHEYQLVYVSPSFEQVWGRSATELYANLNRFVEFIHPDDRDRIQWGWQQCTQVAYTQEYRILRPDGTIAWIRDRGFPIFDHRGELLWIGGIAEDISDRKRSEAERQRVEDQLQQREAELSLITNAVPSLISFVDAEQRYRFNNRTYAEWFGRPVAETYGQHLRDVLGEAAYETIRPYVEQVLAGQQVTYESEVPYRNGGTRHISATYVPRLNAEGAVEGFVALVNDVSEKARLDAERKRIQMALAAQEQRYRYIFETIGVSVWEEDFSAVKSAIAQLKAAGVQDFRQYFTDHPEFVQQAIGMVRLRNVNQASLQVFGAQTKADLLNSLHQIFLPETYPVFVEELLTIAAEGSQFVAETTLQTLQGEPLQVWMTINFPAPDEPYDRVIVSLLDITDRKQAELALRQSEERAQLAIQVARLGTWRYHLNTDLVELDARMAEIWGEPGRARIPLPQVIERIHPDDRDRVTQAIGAALDPYGSGTYRLDYRIVWSDGCQRWISANGQAQFEGEASARQVVEFTGTALDITERKQAEVTLQEREQRLTLATQAANLGVFEWNVQADCAIWENAQMYDIFGHTMEDGTLNKAQSMSDVIHPNDREQFEQCLVEGMKTGHFHATCRIRRRSDGSWRWVESIGQFELAADGTPLRLIGVLNDVSDRKRSETKRRHVEAELRSSAERLSLALAAAKLGDWSWDAATDMVNLSKQAAKIFGIPPGPHMTWTQMRDLIHPDDRDRAKVQVEQAIANHSDYDIEYQVIHADGQSRWIAAKGRAQYDKSGQASGMLGVVQDITPRKQTEQEREQLLASERTARTQAEAANRIKDEFLAVVSHELRSPLNPILGWAQLLRQGQLNEQKTNHALEVIERNAQVQAQLINDLLDVSRILRGKLSLNKKTCLLYTS